MGYKNVIDSPDSWKNNTRKEHMLHIKQRNKERCKWKE